MKTVFISSTSKDLKDYRAAVRDAVMKLGMHPVMMEDFPAIPADAIEVCCQKVIDCDLFIGFYAHRYGHIPKGKTKSMIELEYDWAKEKRKRRHIFVVDPEYAWPINPDVDPESSDKTKLLNDFKERIEGEDVRATFTTPDSLAARVTQSLSHELKRFARERRQQILLITGGITIIVLLLIAIIATIILSTQAGIARTERNATKQAVAEYNKTATAAAWTLTPTLTATVTPSITPSPTITPTPTPTPTLTPTATFTPTFTPTDTPTSTPTATSTPTLTPTSTFTPVPNVSAVDLGVTIVLADFEYIDEGAPRVEPNLEREFERAAIPFVRLNQVITDREQAGAIEEQYDPAVVIWGQVALGGVVVNFKLPPRAVIQGEKIDEIEVVADELDSLETYIFQGMDTLYIVDLAMGQLFYSQNRTDAALEAFNRAAALVPAEREAAMQAQVLYLYRGLANYAQKHFDLALADYDHALELQADYIPAYTNRGNVYTSLESYDLALADYNYAIQLSPADHIVYLSRAALYYQQKQYDLALTDYDYAIELAPDDPKAFSDRGLVYQMQEQYDLALADYNRAIELTPDSNQNWSHYLRRASVYSQQKQIDLALADYNYAVEHGPHIPVTYTLRGNFYLSQNQNELALADFETALQIDPDYNLAHFFRGLFYYNQGQYDLAIVDLHCGDPDQPATLAAFSQNSASFMCQYIYPTLGMYDWQLVNLTDSVESAPDSAVMYYNRGMFYWQFWLYELADADFAQAILLDPAYESAQQMRYMIWETARSLNPYSLGVHIPDYYGTSDLRPLQEIFDERLTRCDEFLHPTDSYAPDDSMVAEELLWCGQALLSSHQYEQATAIYQRSLELDPGQLGAYTGLGNVAMNQGQYEQAATYYERGVYESKCFNAGFAHYMTRQYERALANYGNENCQFLGFPQGYNLRIMMYDALGLYQRASELINGYSSAVLSFDQAGNTIPGELPPYLSTLVPEIESALDTEIVDPAVLLQLANQYAITDDHQLAADLYARVIELDPNNEKAYLTRGLFYTCGAQRPYDPYCDTDLDLALADFNRVIELNPSNAQAYVGRGYVAIYSVEENDRGFADFNRAIELDPNYAQAYMLRGIAYSWQKNEEAALADYTRAIELDPEYKEAYLCRAGIYEARGNYEAALNDLYTYIQIGGEIDFEVQGMLRNLKAEQSQ